MMVIARFSVMRSHAQLDYTDARTFSVVAGPEQKRYLHWWARETPTTKANSGVIPGAIARWSQPLPQNMSSLGFWFR
jgi:hypothetical protein